MKQRKTGMGDRFSGCRSRFAALVLTALMGLTGFGGLTFADEALSSDAKTDTIDMPEPPPEGYQASSGQSTTEQSTAGQTTSVPSSASQTEQTDSQQSSAGQTTQTTQTTQTAAASSLKPALSAKKLQLVSTGTQKLVLKNVKKGIKWKTSKKSVVSISKGSAKNEIILTAKKAGKATITATVGTKKYTCKVTVVYRPEISRTSLKLKEGKTYTIKIKGTVSKPVWTSSDPDVVSITGDSGTTCTLKGQKPGNSVITAVVNGVTLTCNVKVKAAAESTQVGLPENYTGWQDAGGTRFYWINGKRVKGWQQIGAYMYYFTTNKGMYRSCVAGTASSGYHYVDDQGRKVTDSVMELAVKYLRENATAAMTNQTALYRCFWTMRDESIFTYRWHPDYPWNNPSVMRTYAYDTFTTRIGNCWRFGAAMAYVAKALGYESRVAIGGVTAHTVEEQSWLDNHGWCEVYDGGLWKMIDISMQMHHPEANLFMLPRASYPYRWRCDYIYYLHVSADGVSWSTSQ